MFDKRITGFKQTLRQFLASKSNWAGVSAIAVAVAGYVSGEYSLSAATGQVFGGFAVLFVRDAIAGSTK